MGTREQKRRRVTNDAPIELSGQMKNGLECELQLHSQANDKAALATLDYNELAAGVEGVTMLTASQPPTVSQKQINYFHSPLARAVAESLHFTNPKVKQKALHQAN